MVKINYYCSYSVAILHCHKVLIIWISRQLLMNLCQNAILLSRAVLLKFLKIYKRSCFSALSIIVKCTQWCFFKNNNLTPLPPPPFRHYIRQWRMTMVVGLIKMFCPPPPPSSPYPCQPPQRKKSLLKINKFEAPIWYYYFSIFEYWIGCSSLYLSLILMYHIIFIWFSSWSIKLHLLYPID